MAALTGHLASDISAVVAEFASHGNLAALQEGLEAATRDATPDAVIVAAEEYRNEPQVMATLYERVVAEQAGNAHARVVLANAYWLTGRGPDVVGQLATEAIAIDPAHRGAWHLWALSEADPRQRVQRWQQVFERFPTDLLALAAVADNAAAVAGAEKDYDMLDLSVATFERLLERSTEPAQRTAVEDALRVLRGWKF